MDYDTGNWYFPYNVSGSATSTGSFGQGYFDKKIGIGTAPGSELIRASGTNSTTMRLDNTGGTLNYILLKNNTAANNYIQTNAYGIALNADANGSAGIVDLMTNNTIALQIDNSQNVLFKTANQKISGSSTSTGSFGSAHIDDKRLCSNK